MTTPEHRPEPAPELPPETVLEPAPLEPKPETAADSVPESFTEVVADESSDGFGAAAEDVPAAAVGNLAVECPIAENPAERRKVPIYRDFTLLQLAAIIFLVDQFTKFLVRAYLPFGYSYPFDGFFRLTHTHNTGSAFGLLQGQNTPLIFVSFIGIFVLAMIYRSQPHPTNLLRFSLALQIGGALGNLLDRLRLGSVTDFIDVGAWPVFNLADASIVTGLVVLGWLLLRPDRLSNASAVPADADLPQLPGAAEVDPIGDSSHPPDGLEDYPETSGSDNPGSDYPGSRAGPG